MRKAIEGTIALLLWVAGSNGVAGADRRVEVDANRPPWDAVVKVQTNIGVRCTGVLVSPATVLTAAHCLYNPRTLAFLEPVSLHVVVGYQRGAYRWHRPVSRFVLATGFTGRKGPPTADWARLELAEPIPNAVAPLPLAKPEPVAGMRIALPGYNQDRAQVLLADPSCHVTRILGGGALIAHDCAATHGTSGAPLLVRQNGGWAVLGINIAAGKETNLALSIAAIARQD